MDKDATTIAIPKGRLFTDCVDLFEAIGVAFPPDSEISRKLVFPSKDGSVRFMVVRDKDVPAYVDHGAADMGIAGKDVLVEAGKDLLEPLDLKFGHCRIVVAGPDRKKGENPTGWGHTRIATNFPRITTAHFASKGEQVEIIPLYGSIELAPLVGLAERIVDLVSSGETLRQNNLTEIEQVMDVTAKLVVNRASLRTRPERIVPLIEAMGAVVGAKP